jgi:glycosyltransferase involved in cell wall biosynthesis
MADSAHWPAIALVTPVFNSARYLEASIQSVLSQNYPNLQYVIADGGSTDGSVEIIRKYEGHLHAWFSEKDHGMYDAINKAFARTTGELMGWISATDLLHVGSLFVVGSVFRDVPDLEWITGHPTGFSEDGMAVQILNLRRWARMRFLAGANRYIQQESTYWRRSLWERAGSRVDDSRRNASDFELWVRFFRFARLHTVDALIGGYRTHSDSIGLQDIEECHRVHDEIVEHELESLSRPALLTWFRATSRKMQSIPALAKPWSKLVLGTLMKWPGSDLSPVIRYQDGRWQVRP